MKKGLNIKIGKRTVGVGSPSYIIFEVASTHEGEWKAARDYIKIAKEVGADAVKFQLFEADKVLNPISKNLRPTYNYFTKTEAPREWFPKLMELCKDAEIDFLCTPADVNSATYLDGLGIRAIKIASGDLTNSPFLSHVAKFHKPVVLSTGMGNMEEVKEAVHVLRSDGCSQIALLQCVSVYPMPYEDANIAAMNTMQNRFNRVVGYSDNGSAGILVPLVAVAMGASIIEKHVTYKKNRGHLDDVFALSVDEFARMVKRIRELERKYSGRLSDAVSDLRKEFGKDVTTVIGSGKKGTAKHGIPRPDGTRMLEDDERQWARRGVYPERNIKKGEKITNENIILIRPDVGVSVKNMDKVLGLSVSEDLKTRMPIIIENGSVRKFKRSDIQKVYKQKDLRQFANILEKDALFD